jgi:hypothetical protein
LGIIEALVYDLAMVLTPLASDDVTERLQFARVRRDQLLTLNGGDLQHADPHERQQLIQEFFFHLLGAVDVLAQLVNDRHGLGFDSEDVTIGYLQSRLSGDPLESDIQTLYARIRHMPLPTDPYSDEGYTFRAYNYRHQVTHRRRFPLLFRLGSTPPASFILDPRQEPGQGPNHSVLPYDEELDRMLTIFGQGIRVVLAAL